MVLFHIGKNTETIVKKPCPYYYKFLWRECEMLRTAGRYGMLRRRKRRSPIHASGRLSSQALSHRYRMLNLFLVCKKHTTMHITLECTWPQYYLLRPDRITGCSHSHSNTSAVVLLHIMLPTDTIYSREM